MRHGSCTNATERYCAGLDGYLSHKMGLLKSFQYPRLTHAVRASPVLGVSLRFGMIQAEITVFENPCLLDAGSDI